MKDTAKLLSRETFKNLVFERDKGKCVFCSKNAVDAHHIIERRLWTASHESEGYFIDNGISVCEDHHIKCEMTEISVEDARRAAGILKPIIPEHLYDDQIYDKWGNILLPNGTRLKGELFFDSSVQKILEKGGVLDSFSKYVKYPRTYHLSWSESVNKDDRILKNTSVFHGKRVVVSEKMDGENTTCYNDYFHARSIDSMNHPSRNWAKNFWNTFRFDLPEEWRLCAENVYAQHSIKYENLPTYFFGFSIWNEQNKCLSWDDTIDWFALLGVTLVKVLFDGIYDEATIKKLWNPKNAGNTEGYVLRLADEFSYGDFRKSVAKFVRKDHVQTVKHWMSGQPIIPNGLA